MASPKFYRLVERMRANATPRPQTIEELRANMEEVGRKFTPPEGVVFAPADADGVPGEWADTGGSGRRDGDLLPAWRRLRRRVRSHRTAISSHSSRRPRGHVASRSITGWPPNIQFPGRG